MARVTITTPSSNSMVNSTFTASGTKEDSAATVTGIMRPPTGPDKQGTVVLTLGSQWQIMFSGLASGVTYKLIVSVPGPHSDEATGLLVQGGPTLTLPPP